MFTVVGMKLDVYILFTVGMKTILNLDKNICLSGRLLPLFELSFVLLHSTFSIIKKKI